MTLAARSRPESTASYELTDIFLIPLKGKYQSPINIDTDEVEFDETLEKQPLTINYVPENTQTITNTGDTVKVDVDCRGSGNDHLHNDMRIFITIQYFRKI